MLRLSTRPVLRTSSAVFSVNDGSLVVLLWVVISVLVHGKRTTPFRVMHSMMRHAVLARVKLSPPMTVCYWQAKTGTCWRLRSSLSRLRFNDLSFRVPVGGLSPCGFLLWCLLRLSLNKLKLGCLKNRARNDYAKTNKTHYYILWLVKKFLNVYCLYVDI